MINWFIDPPFAFYLLLLIVGLTLLAAWSRTRKRKYLVLLAADVAVAGLFFTLDLAFESEREEIVRKIDEAEVALERRDMNRFFANVSEGFDYRGRTKADLRAMMESVLRSFQVSNFKIRDLRPLPRTGPTYQVEFNLYFFVNDRPVGPLHVIGDFVQDPDKQWRLKTFRVLRDNSELDVFRPN
jgi:hypothetical protein